MRYADEKNGRGGKGHATQGANSPKNGPGIVTFQPLKEHKEQLKQGILDEAKAVEVLDRAIMGGNKVSLGYSPDKNGFFAIVRDGNASFGEGIAVSCWGRDLGRAIVVLAFYLREINPDFPSNVQMPLFDDTW